MNTLFKIYHSFLQIANKHATIKKLSLRNHSNLVSSKTFIKIPTTRSNNASFLPTTLTSTHDTHTHTHTSVISRRKRYPRNLCSPPRSGSCRRERSTRACITEERKEKRRRRRHNRRPINSAVGGLLSLCWRTATITVVRGGSAWQPPSTSVEV